MDNVDQTMREAKEIDRGAQAKHILESALFNEAFDLIRQNFMDDFENSTAAESEKRENAWVAVKMVKQIKLHFESIMYTGKMAEIQRRERAEK